MLNRSVELSQALRNSKFVPNKGPHNLLALDVEKLTMLQKDCKFKDATCHACGKKGHIAPVCRSQDPHPQRNALVQQEEISSNSDSEEFYTLKLTTPAATPIELQFKLKKKT